MHSGQLDGDVLIDEQQAFIVSGDDETFFELAQWKPDKFVRELEGQLSSRSISFVLSEEARKWLARTGFDPVLGARPLKRVIQKRIQNVMALKILRGEFKEGDRVLVDVGPKGELEFSYQTTAEAQPEAV